MIEIYSNNKCQQCQEVKAYFREKGIEFTEHNISESKEARRNLMKKRTLVVPYIIIGEHEFTGFDKEKVEELLRGGVQ